MADESPLYDYLMDMAWCPYCYAALTVHSHFCEACRQRVSTPDELPEPVVRRILEKVK